MRQLSLALLVGCGLWVGCTDTGLYALNRQGSTPGRGDFAGQVCMPQEQGGDFPVKVLFAVEGGSSSIPAIAQGAIVDALNSIVLRFNAASALSTQFALLGYHTLSTGFLSNYGTSADLQGAVTQYANFTFDTYASVSMRAPLLAAETVLSGDMETGCKGAVGRTRYLIVLIAASEDTSCANPAFNIGLNADCVALTDLNQCSACELTTVVEDVMALTNQYGAGQVQVQPIYLRTTLVNGVPYTDPITETEIDAIAQAGGTQPILSDPQDLKGAVNQVNYASLQTGLGVRQLLAFNRNVRARNGQNLADSDGDGLPDVDERTLGTDPQNPDTDGDGLMDGVEVKMGMDPLTPNTPPNCNAFLDSDGDGLNDCEELVLGTDPCTGDTDGDGLPDLVELLSGTNPQVPEDLKDSDGDGIPDLQEVVAHTDPMSADLAFRAEFGYGYEAQPAAPTADGRACYQIAANNVSLAATLSSNDPNHPDRATTAGTNQVYLYLMVGRTDKAHTQGASESLIQVFNFKAPNTSTPAGTVSVSPKDFTTGI